MVRPQENQIGAIFLAKQGILGVELLGSPSLFTALVKNIAQSYALEVVVAQDLGHEQFDQARDWWKESIQSEFTRHPSPGAGEDIRLQAANLIGSGLLWGRNLIHLSCFPLEKIDNQSQQTTRRSSVRDRRRSMTMRSNIE
jgi:hypothetical protein